MLLLKRLLIVLMFAFPLYACDTDEGPMEENLGEAGENIDETVDETGEEIGEATEETQEELGEAGDELADETN